MKAAIFSALLAVVLWSGTFTAVSMSSGALQPAALAGLRWLIAALVLSALLRRIWIVRSEHGISLQDCLLYAVAAVVFFHIALFISATELGAIDLVLAIGGCAGFFIPLAELILRRTLRPGAMAGGVLCLLGAVVTMTKGVLTELDSIPSSYYWLIGAGAIWALSVVLRGKEENGGFGTQVISIMFALPFLGLFACLEAIQKPEALVVGYKSSAALLYLALVPSVACQHLWSHASSRLEPKILQAMMAFFPLISVMFSWLILGESIKLHHPLALLLVCGGLLFQSVRSGRPGSAGWMA